MNQKAIIGDEGCDRFIIVQSNMAIGSVTKRKKYFARKKKQKKRTSLLVKRRNMMIVRDLK